MQSIRIRGNSYVYVKKNKKRWQTHTHTHYIMHINNRIFTKRQHYYMLGTAVQVWWYTIVNVILCAHSAQLSPAGGPRRLSVHLKRKQQFYTGKRIHVNYSSRIRRRKTNCGYINYCQFFSLSFLYRHECAHTHKHA